MSLFKLVLTSSLLFTSLLSEQSTQTSTSSNVNLFGVLFSNGTLTKTEEKPELMQELEEVCSSASKDTKRRTTCIYLQKADDGGELLIPTDSFDRTSRKTYVDDLTADIKSKSVQISSSQTVIVAAKELISADSLAKFVSNEIGSDITVITNFISRDKYSGSIPSGSLNTLAVVLPMSALDTKALNNIYSKVSANLYVSVVGEDSGLSEAKEMSQFVSIVLKSLSSNNLKPYYPSTQTLNLYDHTKDSFVGSISFMQNNFDISPRDAKNTNIKYRKRRGDDESSEKADNDDDDKSCPDMHGKIAIHLSFLVLGIILLVILNIVLFSYAMSKGNSSQSEEENEEEEEEKLIPKSAKSVESKPLAANGGKSSLENIAEEGTGAKKKENNSPVPFRAKGKTESPAPAPIYKTDSTDFWEIEADTGYNEV